jgi:hypothetical protein
LRQRIIHDLRQRDLRHRLPSSAASGGRCSPHPNGRTRPTACFMCAGKCGAGGAVHTGVPERSSYHSVPLACKCYGECVTTPNLEAMLLSQGQCRSTTYCGYCRYTVDELSERQAQQGSRGRRSFKLRVGLRSLAHLIHARQVMCIGIRHRTARSLCSGESQRVSLALARSKL